MLAALHRGAEQVWPLLQRQWADGKPAHRNQMPHFSVEVVPEIASTNAALMRRVREPHAQACILVAAHQSAGRGRMGKVWHSAPGDCLTFSMAMPLAPRFWSGLSLAVGVSVAESLSALSPALDVQLKWPNDLWLREHKLAGILIETAHLPTPQGHPIRWAVIGVGINLQPPLSSDLSGSSPPPHSLGSIPPTGLRSWGLDCDVGSVLTAVAPTLLADVLRFEQDGFQPFQPRFAKRDALWQRPLRLSDGTQGMGMGVDESGVLQLQTAEGWVAVHSQEVSVRPIEDAKGTIC